MAYIRSCGYKVVQMRECDFRKEFPNAYKYRCEKYGGKIGKVLNEGEMLEEIANGNVFGMVKCDVRVPDNLRETYAKFPPIFKNTDVSRNDIGPHMRKIAEEEGLLTRPRRMLISSFFSEQKLIATPLLRWYIEKGFEVTNIEEVIQYAPERCFQDFVEMVTKARQLGDVEERFKNVAQAFKLLGNSAYGRLLMNRIEHMRIKYRSDYDVAACFRSGRFCAAQALRYGDYEVKLKPNSITHDIPVHVGFFVLNYAKKALLSYYYDVLEKYVGSDNFCLLECDTDSLYIGLAGKSVDHLIREKDRYHYFSEVRHTVEVTPACNDHRADYAQCMTNYGTWEPFECCQKAGRDQRRVPGLMKIEMDDCEEMICLSSKTYFCKGRVDDKQTCKGTRKRQNVYKIDDYADVLETKKTKMATNTGFRRMKDRSSVEKFQSMFTVEETKRSLSYFYAKRIVNPDGITTEPLLL